MNKETTLLNDKDNLIADNMNLVHYFVKKIKLAEIRFYDYDDIFQIGSIGLIKAANTYNGITKFSTYASRCINNEIYMFFRNKNRFELIKYLDEPVCKNEDDEEITLLELIPNGIGVYDEVQKLLDIESVYNVLLNNFSYDNILLMLYTANSKKQKFIASKFNISQSAVSRSISRLILEVKHNVKYNIMERRLFSIDVTMQRSKICFVTNNNLKAKKLMTELKSNFKYIKKFKVSYINNRVSIVIPYVDILLDVVILLVEAIKNYSIELYELY